MLNLVGEYHFKLDAKGRLSLPSAFRKVLSKNLMVTLSPKGDCLYVFEPDGFGAWVNSLFEHNGGFNPSSRKQVAVRTMLNSRARAVEVDGSGRIGIPAPQRADASLDKDVVVIGNTDHFEIWDAKRWDEFAASVDLGSIFSD